MANRKVYFGIEDAACNNEVGDLLKVAVKSCVRNTQLQPIVLFDGQNVEYERWLSNNGAQVIKAQVSFKEKIVELNKLHNYPMKAAGAFLRTNICQFNNEDEFALYCDCDVMFQRDVDYSRIRPDYIAVAPSQKVDDWSYFNSGVMVMNLPNLRKEYLEFEGFIRENMLRNYPGLDEPHFNAFYRDRWDRLPIELNWRPFWGYAPAVPIVHLHAVKFSGFLMLLDGSLSDRVSIHARNLRQMALDNLEAFYFYFRDLLKYSEACSCITPMIEQILDRLNRRNLEELKDRLEHQYRQETKLHNLMSGQLDLVRAVASGCGRDICVSSHARIKNIGEACYFRLDFSHFSSPFYLSNEATLKIGDQSVSIHLDKAKVVRGKAMSLPKGDGLIIVPDSFDGGHTFLEVELPPMVREPSAECELTIHTRGFSAGQFNIYWRKLDEFYEEIRKASFKSPTYVPIGKSGALRFRVDFDVSDTELPPVLACYLNRGAQLVQIEPTSIMVSTSNRAQVHLGCPSYDYDGEPTIDGLSFDFGSQSIGNLVVYYAAEGESFHHRRRISLHAQ